MVFQYWEEEDPFPHINDSVQQHQKGSDERVVCCAEMVARKSGAPVTEVTNAALQVESNRERQQAAAAARELAERRLDAEQSRFDVGLSTNFFVVQAQRDLRDAQNAELRALLDYRKAQVEFARVQEVPTAGGAVVSVINAAGNGAATPRAAGGGGGFGGGN